MPLLCCNAWHSFHGLCSWTVSASPNVKHSIKGWRPLRGKWSLVRRTCWQWLYPEVQMPGLQGKCLVTFASPLNAVRFCHVTQVALMFAKWPADGQHICGPEKHNVEGRLLFAGPRVAMAPAQLCRLHVR